MPAKETPQEYAAPNASPLVTIAIPTYNRAASYLPQVLTSALSQSYPSIEIIVSDNGSSDHTDRVVASFSDPRIRYCRQQKNIGAADNAHFCLRQGKGVYFLLLHDDDLIDPDFIECCMRAAQYRPDFGIIRTGTRVIDSTRRVLYESANRAVGLSTEDFFLGWFGLKTSMYLCSTLFNTQRLREIGGLRSRHYLFDDAMAMVQLASRYGRVDVEDVKASFRNHDVRLSTAGNVADWCEDSLELLETIVGLASKNQKQLRSAGMKFLSRKNYRHASLVRSSWRRFLAHMIVYRSYGFRYPPPLRGLVMGASLMRRIDAVKRRLKSALVGRAVLWARKFPFKLPNWSRRGF